MYIFFYSVTFVRIDEIEDKLHYFPHYSLWKGIKMSRFKTKEKKRKETRRRWSHTNLFTFIWVWTMCSFERLIAREFRTIEEQAGSITQTS